jgi:hypothetical protein
MASFADALSISPKTGGSGSFATRVDALTIMLIIAIQQSNHICGRRRARATEGGCEDAARIKSLSRPPTDFLKQVKT